MSSYSNNLGKKRRDVSLDRISTMPVVILCHILSFLPTSEAVATMLVSRKFKNLWKNITTLDFAYYFTESDRVNLEKLMRFVSFVNRVFLVLKTKSIDKLSIDLFTLDSMHHYILRYNLSNWIVAAVARNVKTIELSDYYAYVQNAHLFELPSCTFSCKSLEILDISRCVVILGKSSLVRLPNLRILHLDYVSFQDPESVDKLISGCPSLHTLCMKRRLEENVARFSIRSLTLELLEITSFTDSSSRRRGREQHVINRLIIDTPELRYLTLKQTMINYFSIRISTQIIEAKIYLGAALCDPGTLGHLIQALSNVEVLSLDATDNWLESPPGHALVWPMFPNLTKLRLWNFSEQLDVLMNLLQNSPALETLILRCSYEILPNSLSESYVLPRRISQVLTTVRVDYYYGIIDQLKVVEFILLNAGALKTMEIVTRNCSYRKKVGLLQGICNLPTRSRDCRIIFY